MLFFHLINLTVVNRFTLFKEQQAKFPENEALQKSANSSLAQFREELVRQLCDIPEYDVPPEHDTEKPAPPPSGVV